MLNLNLRRGVGEERVGKRGCPLLGLAVVTGVLPVQSGCPRRGEVRQRERERERERERYTRSSHSACLRFTICMYIILLQMFIKSRKYD